ncbi:MAG: FIST C-terminal domain-containing protein [Holophagaceae bacterium]|nr:FIST C-terminal domain-containing protein [Holophagaceae bacterium]
MLKCASLYTFELDSPELALEEIKTQLAEKIVLQKNTVGIVMCHPEFILSGILQHIGENLPFDLAGVTTSSQCVNDEVGEQILTIFVMTSDDVQFVAGITESVEEDVENPVQVAFGKVPPGMVGGPKLILAFPPLLIQYAGEAYIRAFEKVAPNVPVYGTLAVDDNVDFRDSQTIYRDTCSKNAMSYVLCYGNINPRFIVGSLPLEKTLPFKGTVTKSSGPFVQTINDISSYKYFEGIGAAKHGILSESYLFVPFAIHQKQRSDYDGIPVIRVLTTFTEEGAAIFRGDVDEGSTFTMLNNNDSDILDNSKQNAEQINKLEDVAGAMLFSCIIRRMVTIHPNSVAELQNVRNSISPNIPFMMGYAGGEICPTSIRDGVPANRFHNHSLIILVV